MCETVEMKLCQKIDRRLLMKKEDGGRDEKEAVGLNRKCGKDQNNAGRKPCCASGKQRCEAGQGEPAESNRRKR